MVDIKHVLKWHAYQNIPLTYEEAYALGEYVLAGCNGDTLAQVQSVAALCALHNRATYSWKSSPMMAAIHERRHRLPIDAAEQIAGLVAAIYEHDIAKSEYGFLNPAVPYAIDNCGMGGDLVITPNVSTLAAFIAAAGGVPMCKHGSPANADKGKYGSSDFIGKVCGINEYADKGLVEQCVERFCFGYTEALDTRYKRIHLQTHQFAQLPHMNDIIGPMTNPLNPKLHTKKLIGINHLIPASVVASAYRILNERGVTNLHRGLFVRGFVDTDRYQGMDEVSICEGGTHVAELFDGEIVEYDIFAKDFGIEPVSYHSIMPDVNKGQYSMQILEGKSNGAALDLICANAAIIFFLAGTVQNLRDGFSAAKRIFASGRPLQLMLDVKAFIPK